MASKSSSPLLSSPLLSSLFILYIFATQITEINSMQLLGHGM
jgi:hypothetical protein